MNDKGNSNPSGNSSFNGSNPKINPMTGEPFDPNHWGNLR